MTVLVWRPWTRATLLQRMREQWVGLTLEIADIEPPPVEVAGLSAQLVEDLRLGVPAPIQPVADGICYRRRPDSIVYHSCPDCPAWPAGAPYEEVAGWPGLGMRCRRCEGSQGRNTGGHPLV